MYFVVCLYVINLISLYYLPQLIASVIQQQYLLELVLLMYVVADDFLFNKRSNNNTSREKKVSNSTKQHFIWSLKIHKRNIPYKPMPELGSAKQQPLVCNLITQTITTRFHGPLMRIQYLKSLSNHIDFITDAFFTDKRRSIRKHILIQ